MAAANKTAKTTRKQKPLSQDELIKLLLSKTVLYLLLIMFIAVAGSYFYLRVRAATP